MNLFKIMVVSAIACCVLFIYSHKLDNSLSSPKFGTSTEYSEVDKAFLFDVPEDGQMMRFEIRGSVPTNQWQAVEIEVFNANDKYLFTYADEIWAESGREDGEYWEEHQSAPDYGFRFPEKGQYKAYVSSTSSNGVRYQFTFRVVPIEGDKSQLKPVMWMFGIIAVICFAMINQMDNGIRVGKFDSSVVVLLLIAIIPTWWAIHSSYDRQFSFISWPFYTNHYERLVVDRQISGKDYRTSSLKGGK